MPIYIVEYCTNDLADSVGYFTDKRKAEQCCEYLNRTKSGLYYDYGGEWKVVEYNLDDSDDYEVLNKELDEREQLEYVNGQNQVNSAELAELERLKAKYETPRKAKWKLNRDGSGTCSNCHKRTAAVYDHDRYDRFCSCCGFEMSLETE